MSASTLRSRWAAIGAAVAVCLGAGGVGISQATTSSGEMPVYISITPCRLADTRPAPDNVGPRSTPLGAGETYTLDGGGTVGNCVLPAGTSALALNVTAVNPTQLTYLTLWAADATQPVTSNLNPAPGQPPTPNAVNVALSPTSEFKVFNELGTVDVIIDVVGYYDDHVHSSLDLVDEPGVVYAYDTGLKDATTTPSAIVSTLIQVPADGYVSIAVTGNWQPATTGTYDKAICQLQKGGAAAIDYSEPWFILDDLDTSTAVRWEGFSAHRVMPIARADNGPGQTGQAISLVCDKTSGSVKFDDNHISATFFASSYKVRTVGPMPIGP